MEMNIDIFEEKRKKSVFRIIFGICCGLLAVSWIIVRFFKNEIITPFDWCYFVIFVLNGVAHTTEGLGYPFESLFGKTYILINSELIKIKAGVCDKEQFINWNEIISIDYKVNLQKLEIVKADNTIQILDINKLDYKLLIEVKKTIGCIAKEKNIPSNL